MNTKVILISVDGMRSDGLQQCGNPYVKELEKFCAYTYCGRSVMPSVTFPCHYAMAHSLMPERHRMESEFIPKNGAVKGIFEKVREMGGTSAMFYNWEPIRYIASPNTLKHAILIDETLEESSDTALTQEAEYRIRKYKPDFAFLYMVETDTKGGHNHGWMSEEYLRRLSVAIDNVKRIIEAFKNEYTVIVMSDHGGHGYGHGTEQEEDMTIPFFFFGKDFSGGKIIKDVSLLDIAPTIASVLGIDVEPEWEGRSLL